MFLYFLRSVLYELRYRIHTSTFPYESGISFSYFRWSLVFNVFELLLFDKFIISLSLNVETLFIYNRWSFQDLERSRFHATLRAYR